MPVCLFAGVRVCLPSASSDCPPAPSPAPQQHGNMSLSHLLRFPLEQCPKTGKCHCPSNYQSVCEVCAIVGVCSAGSKIGVPCDLSSAFAPGQGGCIIPDNSTVIVHICWHVNERIAPQTRRGRPDRGDFASLGCGALYVHWLSMRMCTVRVCSLIRQLLLRIL